MFVDLDWPLNASSLLSASAGLLVVIGAVQIHYLSFIVVPPHVTLFSLSVCLLERNKWWWLLLLLRWYDYWITEWLSSNYQHNFICVWIDVYIVFFLYYWELISVVSYCVTLAVCPASAAGLPFYKFSPMPNTRLSRSNHLRCQRQLLQSKRASTPNERAWVYKNTVSVIQSPRIRYFTPLWARAKILVNGRRLDHCVKLTPWGGRHIVLEWCLNEGGRFGVRILTTAYIVKNIN